MMQIPRGGAIQAQVRAMNGLFSSEPVVTAFVRLMGTPSAPDMLTSEETAEGNLRVAWTAPSDTGYGNMNTSLLTMYEVLVSLCEASTCQTSSKRINSSDAEFASRSTLITADMLPQTSVTYQLAVRARNAFGWSSSSASIQQDYQ
jgi:hypothetical protein